MATHRRFCTQPALVENPLSKALPDGGVLPTFALYGQQSTSALSRSPSRVRYSVGTRITRPRIKDGDPLLSSILFDPLANPARSRIAPQNFESHAPSSSLREDKDLSSPFIVQRSSSDGPQQSNPDHGRDIVFFADELLQTMKSSEIGLERGLYSTPGSIHHTRKPQSDYPQRELSYGEKLTMPKHQSLPRGAASRQLRRKAGWSTEKGDASPGDRRNSNNFRVRRSPEFCKVDSNNFSPPQRKLRLDTSTSESGESIKQAYITTVTSLSKPQIISITRRSSSFQDMSSFHSESRSVSNPFPVTPPETPATDQKVRNGIGNVPEQERTHRIKGNPSDKIKLCVTPPNTPFSSHCILECKGSDVSHGSSRSSIRTSLRQQPLDWILDELEFTITNFPRLRLQLNSPVIQHLRLPDVDYFIEKWRERYASSPSKLPHSRYSIFKSLSSHPATPQSAQIPRDLQNYNLAAFDSLHPDPLTDPTVCALQTIFPNAELPALECLQATYLALNYLLLTQPPYFTRPSFLPSSPGEGYPLSLSTVPPKAREMLDIQPPTSISQPKTWFYPQTLESGDDGLRKRIDDLVARLRNMVGDLLGEFRKKKLGIYDNAFLTAVGEVIKMGEERTT